jgi:general secretion pathway protein I
MSLPELYGLVIQAKSETFQMIRQIQDLLTRRNCHRARHVPVGCQNWPFLQFPPGFTLIEVLVAITLLAVALVAILQLFSGGLRSIRLSDEYSRGIFHARELVEQVQVSEGFSEGVLQGRFEDGYRWKAEIKRSPALPEEERKPQFELFEVKVSVVWDSSSGEKHLELMTTKIGEKSEGEG